jgi:hypothetical protein
MADKDKKKKKKAKFQKGDYSDIKVKGIIDPVKREVIDVPLLKGYQDPKIKYNMPKPYIENEGQYKSMEPPKKKKYITVPRDSKNIPKFKSGGRTGYKVGKSVKKMGCAIKGKSPILR